MASSSFTSPQQGFSNAAFYDKARPEYPGAVLDLIIERAGLSSTSKVCDLGAGTGKFTRMLAQRKLNVVAVEPVEQMRAQLEQHLPGVSLAGTAQAIPLPQASVDCVTAAQCFHWFATRPALEEIHRVLKPGGTLALVWNVLDEKRPEWKELEALMRAYHDRDPTPFYKDGRWRLAFEGTQDLFSPLEHIHFENPPIPGDREAVAARLLSNSFIAGLPQEGQQRVREEIFQILDRHGLAGPDAPCVVPYTTELFITRKNS